MSLSMLQNRTITHTLVSFHLPFCSTACSFLLFNDFANNIWTCFLVLCDKYVKKAFLPQNVAQWMKFLNMITHLVTHFLFVYWWWCEFTLLNHARREWEKSHEFNMNSMKMNQVCITTFTKGIHPSMPSEYTILLFHLSPISRLMKY